MTKLLHPSDLHPYQQKAVIFQCDKPHSMLWLDMGLGKQQPDSEPVLTPDGWRPIGSIRVGDNVIGSDGKPTEVLGVFPQGDSETLRVTFTDGSFCHAGWEHLWSVQNPSQKARGQVGHVMTTRQLVDSKLKRKMGNRYEAYWHIPMVKSVEHDSIELPIEPYTMGVLLGDGCLTGGHANVCTDIETIAEIGATLLRPHESCEYVGYGSLRGMTPIIRALGLDNKRSDAKFVPSVYMHSSKEQRLALLQGLLDTDGSPISGGGVEFSSTSPLLIDACVELSQSLGGTAYRSPPRHTNHQNGVGLMSWRVNVKLPADMNPFKLSRKLAKWQRPTKYPPSRKIEAVEIIGREHATCIKVAAPDSLYVTRNHIVTHNTSVTLTSIKHLLDSKVLTGVVIIAPSRVIKLVWRQEAVKWSHTSGLKFSLVQGTRDQRTRALLRPADVHLISYDVLGWLAETLHTYYISKKKPLPFDGIVWDEISKMKNSTTQRVKSFMKVANNFKWRTGLTGTPASNGYKDLHGQYLVVDGGQRLGTSKTAFRTRFYKKAGSFREVPYDDTEFTIKNLIGDITLEMSAEDYNPLPSLIVNDVNIELPPDIRAKYDRLEKEFFLMLDSGQEIEAFNQAALTNKCLQFSNGAMYPIAGMPLWEKIHDLKLDALEEIIDEAQGNPVLCAYAYRSDAERIMDRFKELRPINLTACKTEVSLVNAMHRWAIGDCQLMIGHPACLHPWTEVLTERRGWVKLINVKLDDRVFDGVEFVSHSGCFYSGYKDVVDVCGITMTLNHKLFINDQWVEAKDVRDTEEVRIEALHLRGKTEDYRTRSMRNLWRGFRDVSPERNQEQSRGATTLSEVYRYYIPQQDPYTHLENMVRHEVESEGRVGQKLWGSWDRVVRGVGEFRQLLSGYVGRVFGRPDNRACGREQALREKQLRVGDEYGAAVQQAKQQGGDVPRGTDAPGRACKTQRFLEGDAHHAVEPWDDGGRISSGLSEVNLREKSESCEHPAPRKAHVYDLVDCGSRHQFVIRNVRGEVFISHNSMGHGVDGLQKMGNTLVWFGLNWSLDLYDQMNARIRRQGQGKPVTCHRLLTIKTLDQAQAIALNEKADTQAGLRNAIKSYRQSL